jgi:hypothetical protein
MNPDFLDLLTALSDADARFLVVGGYAVGVHGRPRATKDLDVWIEASADNARKVMQALREFGAPIGDLAERDLEMPGTGFKMGEPPARIDILRTDLLTNKRAAGRPQDLADVAALERLEKAKGKR